MSGRPGQRRNRRYRERMLKNSTGFTKNQEIEVFIEDFGKNGEGIGHADGYTLFIKDAVPGDRILAGITKAGKNYGYARVIKVLEPSPDRVIPPCPAAKRCGGCQLMTVSTEAQLRFKEKIVADALERIGRFKVRQSGRVLSGENGEAECIELLPIVPSESPLRYRNKAQ